MGGKIGLKPIWILISIFIGARVADILDVLIAVPVASVIKRIAEDIRKENKAIKERKQALVTQ
jgi:predicted PurR-regulated permease PerM